MRYSLNQIKIKLEEFATRHQQINEFGFGDISDLLNNKDQMFPQMFAIPRPSAINDKLIDINLDLLFFDLVKKDESNEAEIWSDMLQVALDLRAWLQNPEFDDLFSADISVAEPFTDRFDEEVTGWRVPVRFRVIDIKDRCAIPLSA